MIVDTALSQDFVEGMLLGAVLMLILALAIVWELFYTNPKRKNNDRRPD